MKLLNLEYKEGENIMKFEKGEIEGVVIKKLVRFSDERGFLIETYRKDFIPKHTLPVMSVISYTKPGIVRGPNVHSKQNDIFSFFGPGNFKIRLWDDRKESETHGNYMDIFAGEENQIMFTVPAGVVHGYKNISQSENGLVISYADQLYKGWDKKEPVDKIRYDDGKPTPFTIDD
jgi:dTDP-4-dehydrorhamnose 3,5-epimerase